MIDIPSIQKRKFLNNVYRALYAKGTQPNDQDVRRLFSSYFSQNVLGSPVNVNFTELDQENVIDVDILNQLMANTLLNLEVLYDLVWENNNQILSVVTALNNRLDNLRAKRKELEAAVDQLIFSNENSDGYFYSVLDNFATTDKVDLDLSTAYVDTVNGLCSVPVITSDLSSAIAADQITSSSVSMSKYVNGSEVYASSTLSDFDMVFDGLTDTYWSTVVEASTPSVASIVLDIPISSSFSVSKINLSIMSVSPCSAGIVLTPSDSTQDLVEIIKGSKSDYDKFSFIVPNQRYSRMSLTLYKYEHDELVNGSSLPYKYRFGISEISIGADYHDKKGVLVSSPLSLPVVDNSNLEISTVGVDVDHSSPEDSLIRYYVAPDVDGAQSVSDFNWYAIEPGDLNGGSFATNISFLSSNLKTEYFNSPASSFSDVVVDNNSDNVNMRNPIPVPFAADKSAYRFKNVPSGLDLYNPFILSGINGVRSYFEYSSSPADLYKSVSYWLGQISDGLVTPDLVKNQSVVLNAVRASGSGFMSCKIMCEDDARTVQTIVKSSLDFNLSVYLNGNLICDLPRGNISSSIEWNFVRGVNNIQIGYDNFTNFTQTVSIMSGVSLAEYGTIYLDYFTYLDPIEFRRRPFESLNAFTVQDIYGQKQIISTKQIQSNSLIRYYQDVGDVITAIRYRIDMFRGSNPLVTPTVNAIRTKFKHTDS